MATFQEQMMQTILPRFIEGMNQFNTRLKELEGLVMSFQSDNEDTLKVITGLTALTTNHGVAIHTIEKALKDIEEHVEASKSDSAEAEQPQSSDKDTTILVSKHDLAIATIKDVLKNQLERIAVLDDIKVQLDNAIDRINDLEARMAEAKPVRRKRKAPAEEPAVE